MKGFLSMIFLFTLTATIMALSNGALQSSSRTIVQWIEESPKNRNCKDVQRQGHKEDGVYTIFPYDEYPNRPLKVYCDMVTEGGGWTVIQRRDDIQPREDFNRTWQEYALGFGNVTGEFWLGLDHIHVLTEQTMNKVRFLLEDFENNTRWAEYKFFYVHNRENFFKMEVNGYSGDAGDSLAYHNSQKFSAKDNDHDSSTTNCAASYKGGWWYNGCHYVNLNGLYLEGLSDSQNAINWNGWRGNKYSLKKTEIKLRPAY